MLYYPRSDRDPDFRRSHTTIPSIIVPSAMLFTVANRICLTPHYTHMHGSALEVESYNRAASIIIDRMLSLPFLANLIDTSLRFKLC